MSSLPLVPCLSGLFCSTNPAQPHICKMPATGATAGAACDPGQGIQTSSAPCAVGYYCGSDYQCHQKGHIDDNCDPAQDPSQTGLNCNDGLICYHRAYIDPVSGAGSAKCEPYVLPSANSPYNRCDSDASHLTSPQCVLNAYCDASVTPAVCRDRTMDGKACVPGTGTCDATNPLPGETCIEEAPDAGTSCVPVKTFGSTCEPGVEDSVCVTGYCNPLNGKCAVMCQ
jgi:hypothetical protein